MMSCNQCGAESLEKCSCKDLDDRMRKITDGKYVAAKWCATCDHHYARCFCVEPDWKLRADGKLGPMPGEPGGPTTLADVMKNE